MDARHVRCRTTWMLVVSLTLILSGCAGGSSPSPSEPSLLSASPAPTIGVAPGTASPSATTTPARSPAESLAPVSAPVAVTGSTGPCEQTSAGYHCPGFVASDPRLTGVAEVENECNPVAEGDETIYRCQGTHALTTELGTWQGEFTGTSRWTTSDQAHRHVVNGVSLGADGLEGLRFVYRLTGVDFPWDMSGFIEPIGEPVAVMGAEWCDQVDATGSGEVWYTCVDATSDARASGRADVYVSLEHTTFPTAMSGTFKLTNDDGTWDGDWTGEITRDGNHVIEGVLVGGGAYDGLRYVVRWEGGTIPLWISGRIESVP